MTKARRKVYLTRHDRKDRLGHGGVKAVAEELGINPSLVSRVVNDRQRHAGVEEAIARRIVHEPHEVAFPPRRVQRTRDNVTAKAS